MSLEKFPSEGSERKLPNTEKGTTTMSRRDFIIGAASAVQGLTTESLVTRERIPQEKDVLDVFDKMRESREFTERRHKTDEQGIYLWEVEFEIDDGSAEFSFMREGTHPEGKASSSKIYITFFDSDGMPEGGEDIAEFKDGVWKIKPYTQEW